MFDASAWGPQNWAIKTCGLPNCSAFDLIRTQLFNNLLAAHSSSAHIPLTFQLFTMKFFSNLSLTAAVVVLGVVNVFALTGDQLADEIDAVTAESGNLATAINALNIANFPLQGSVCTCHDFYESPCGI